MARGFCQRPARHFHHRLKLCVLRAAQPFDFTELLLRRVKQRTQATELQQGVACKIDGAAAGYTGAQEYGEQLRIREDVRALLEQPLARALRGRPVGYSHGRSRSCLLLGRVGYTTHAMSATL